MPDFKTTANFRNDIGKAICRVLSNCRFRRRASFIREGRMRSIVPSRLSAARIRNIFPTVAGDNYLDRKVWIVDAGQPIRLLHFNVTALPTSDWTLQQLREAVGDEECFRYLRHDRDRIFAKRLDESIGTLGISVLKSPPHSPKANAICERVIGTIRRECLDWLIPNSESHLRLILKEWVNHYNTGRPHMSFGPGMPDPPTSAALTPRKTCRHRPGERSIVLAKSILRVLHHEYSRVAFGTG